MLFRSKVVTGVCLVLEHEILDLTKSIATLDQVSGGRLLLGVGVGWNREELANVSSVPWSQRYNAMRETVEAMRPYYVIRAVGGLLFVLGSLIMAYNIWRTIRGDAVRDEAEPIAAGEAYARRAF